MTLCLLRIPELADTESKTVTPYVNYGQSVSSAWPIIGIPAMPRHHPVVKLYAPPKHISLSGYQCAHGVFLSFFLLHFDEFEMAWQNS